MSTKKLFLKTSFLALLVAVLKRIFIRLWVAPFYALTFFPFIVIGSFFGTAGEDRLTGIVDMWNGPADAAVYFDESDIMLASLNIFIAINILIELALFATGRGKSGIGYKVEILIKSLVCFGGWVVVAIFALGHGEAVSFALAAIGIGLVSLAFFGVEYVIRQAFQLLPQALSTIFAAFKGSVVVIDKKVK